MDARCFGEDYSTRFDPEWYLNEYYASKCYFLSETTILRKLHDHLGQMANIPDGKLLEFGCGPTVHVMFLASRVFREITMAEYAKPNRDMVEKWLRKEEGAFDWSHLLNFVASMENKSPDTIAERTRAAVKEVIPCDVNNENILLDATKGPFDFIISILCLQAACLDIASYKKAIYNLCSLLKPGGKLFLHELYGESFYKVKDCRFFSLPVTLEEVYQSVESSGMIVESFDHGKLENVQQAADYEGYFSILARKA